MDLYSKAVEFLKMKKHICAGRFFNIGLHVCVIYASDDRIFIGCSSGNDEGEYNTFLEMKTISPQLYIKKIICVDEYECVYLPSMKFIDYIVSDNEKNSEAFVFVDVSHVRPVYSFIQNKRITAPSFMTSPVRDEWQDNNKEIYRNNNIVHDNNIINRNTIETDNLKNKKPDNFIRKPQNIKDDMIKSYADIDFSDNFAGDFEDSADMKEAVSKPVIVMKRESGNIASEKNTEPETEMKSKGSAMKEAVSKPVIVMKRESRNVVPETEMKSAGSATREAVSKPIIVMKRESRNIAAETEIKSGGSANEDEKNISGNDEHENKEKDILHSSLSIDDVKKFAAAAKNFFTKPL